MSDHSLPATTHIGSLPVIVAVVEDDPGILEVLTTLLSDEGIEAEACPLGWQAHLCIRKILPKVVILDVYMPSVDGIKLFYMLRADRETASIPVIFITANPQKVADELPNYEEMGAVLLSKPFDLQLLVDLVHAAAMT